MMTRATRRARWVHVPLLVAALGSIAPPVRWCTLDWDQLVAACVLRCSIAPARPAPVCPLAPASESAAVSAMPPCMDAQAGDRVAACAMASEGCTAARSAARDARPRSAHHRAYLLEGPRLASKAPERHAGFQPPRAADLPGDPLAALDPNAPVARRPIGADIARPPDESASARPPVRGPPARA